MIAESQKILFKELELSIIILEKARKEIINSPLLNDITLNTKKLTYQQQNRYLQIRDEQFKIFMNLFESMILTLKEKAKQKVKPPQPVKNNLQSIIKKYA